MPGLALDAQCPCGFSSVVFPGSRVNPLSGLVIAYKPDGADLITVDDDEAKERGLRTIPDPYATLPLELAQEAKFQCPSCNNCSMYFVAAGLWD